MFTPRQQELISLWNDLKNYPSIAAISERMRTAKRNVYRMAALIRKDNPSILLDREAVYREDSKKIPAAEIPNLPDGERPIEEVIKQALQENQRQQQFHAARNIIDVKINHDGPIAVALLPDPHLDDSGSDLQSAIKHAEIIRDTPGMYAVCVGDFLNNFHALRSMHYLNDESVLKVSETFRLQEWWLTQMASKFVGIASGNHDCLDMETEALTKRGWKTYRDIDGEDMVLGIEPSTGIVKWQPIYGFIEKQAEFINELETLPFSLACTDKHRVLHSRRKSYLGKHFWGDLEYKEMQELTKGRIKIPVSGICGRMEYPIAMDTIRLSALMLTDSHIADHITFYQRESNAEEVRKILKAADVVYKERHREREISQICGTSLKSCEVGIEFDISRAESKRLVELTEVSTRQKLPEWAWNLSDKQFDILLQTLVQFDGTRPKHTYNAMVLYKEKPFLDEIQSLCVMHGYSAHIYEYEANSGLQYRLNICRRSFCELDVTGKIERKPYNDKVWCLSVPLTNFMVRRHGKCHFTGNCWVSRAGVDPLGMALNKLQISGIYGTDQVRVRLNLPGGSSFIYLIRHIFPGHSKYNAAHGVLAWLLEQWQGETAVIGGHKHVASHVSITRDWEGESRVVHGVQLSSYKKIDQYAVTRGFRKCDPFTTPALVHTSDGKTRFVPTIEEAQDWLKFLAR